MTPSITSATPVIKGFRELAAYVRRSQAALLRDDAAGRLPVGFKIGNSRRWLKSEIDSWIEAGCPLRAEWEAHRRSTR